MKNLKTRRLLLWGILILTFLFVFLFPITQVNAEANKVDDKLEEIINGQLNELDLKELEEYLSTIQDFQNENLIERLMDYVKGKEFDYNSFAESLLKVFFKTVIELLPSFSCIAAITLLTGLISTIKSESGGVTSANMIFLIGYAAALLPIFSILMECFQTVQECISDMKKQMHILFPLMLTLMSASGGTLSAAICRPAVAFFSTNIVSIMSSVILPITAVIIVFSMAGNLSPELRINKFTAFFKSMNKWIIGICVSIFGLFFTLQGITASGYDGIVRRAAKYAIGNGVPIVGGFLSGGFDLAVAGSVLIKNSLGGLGVFLMVCVLFEPVILLLSVNLLFRFTAAITQPFGDSKISDFLGETSENLNYCTAVLLFTGFLYFLMIVLMIFSSEALF